MNPTTDVLVIGAGIAGLSAGAALAQHVSVIVAEMEATPAHHATGRSAALYLPTYGPATVRRLARASGHFFHSANDGRSPTPLVSPRPVLYVVEAARRDRLTGLIERVDEAGGGLEPIDAAAARQRCPALRADWVDAGAIDHHALDIDVAATVATFRSMLVHRGGRLMTKHRVVDLERSSAGWRATTAGGTISAGTIVNAAGAWVDRVATMAGVEPLGMQPKRRTIGIGPIAAAADPGDHFVAHAEMDFYFRGEHGDLMFSPADETPSEPTDARPEELDVAIALDRINAATTFGLRSVRQSWAGLRTFAPDGLPVIGPDPADTSFVWCAGQGGYGIKTSPAAGAATASSALGQPLPSSLTAVGLAPSDLLPDRIRASSAAPERG